MKFSDEVTPSTLWKRLYRSFNYGDLIITLGTGKISPDEEDELGLIGEHNYAVLDLKESSSSCLLLIKNPWSKGDVWKWSTSTVETDSEPDSGSTADEPLLPGTFWMDVHKVVQYFETMYLNWNSQLFSSRRDIHFTWELSSDLRSSGSFDTNPQYVVHSEKGGLFWVLLSRHFRGTMAEASKYERSSHGSDTSPDTPRRKAKGYMSLYVFTNGGHRVVLSDGFLVRSSYVDSSSNLLRLELQPRTSYTVVISEQELPQSSYNMSLTFLAPSTFESTLAPEKFTHRSICHGAWTLSNAGGNAGSKNYHLNPQFTFVLSGESDVQLYLGTDKDDIAVHVKLLWAGGKKISPQITKKDIVGDSAEYRRGSTVAEIRAVPAGTYTVVCSTFHENQTCNFVLKVGAMSPCRVESISHQQSLFLQDLPPISFQDFDRVLARILVARLTRLHFRARNIITSTDSPRSPLLISIEDGQGPNKRVIATTGGGDFAYVSAGLQSPSIDVQPSMCCSRAGLWIVVERAGGSNKWIREDVEMILESSEQGVQIGIWCRERD